MTASRRAASLVAALIVATLSAPTVRAGLLVTANDDAYTAVHDRTLSVAAPGLLANDTGVARTAAKTSNPAHGTVTVNTNGSFTYQPDAGYVGSDSFGYEARVLNLGILFTDPATVTLTIRNGAPTAVNDTYAATTGVSLVVPAPGVIANDTDPDGDPLSAVLVDGSGNGSVTLSSDGSFSFKSGGSFTGTRTFTYRVTDGVALSNVATVSITVTPPAPTPTPTPTATPQPTPTPTATPSPTPSETPSPTPTPAPTPPLPSPPVASLPLPSLPLPSMPLPTLPGTSAPAPTPGTSLPAASGSTPSPGPTSSDTSTTGGLASSPGAGSPAVPDAGGTTTARTGGTTAPGGGGGFVVGPSGPSPLDGPGAVDLTGFGDGVDWAVPSLVLSVPGLLIVLAISAQLVGGIAWVPLVRRWLGEFGLGRRRKRSEPAPTP